MNENLNINKEKLEKLSLDEIEDIKIKLGNSSHIEKSEIILNIIDNFVITPEVKAVLLEHEDILKHLYMTMQAAK